MAVPKQRKTKSRRDNRRMHLFIEKPAFGVCPKCGKSVKPHTVCFHCGYYKGVEVMDVLKKLTKKERKKREKEITEKEKEPARSSGGEKREKSLSMEELSRK